MSAVAAASRVGWCPGALRPMASGDGLIVRLKPRGGMLTPAQAIGIAAAAARYGNGALELTSRANLQIRGIGEARLSDLTAALDDLGLLDASPEAEARRNVVASPLAGLDPSAAFDIRPAVQALEARLAGDASLAGLPAKFGFSVSDGGAWPLDGVAADVRFEATLGRNGRPELEARLDGGNGYAVPCREPALPVMAARLACVFLDARRQDPELLRMRDLVIRDGAEAVFVRAGLVAVRSAGQRTSRLAMQPIGPIVLGDRDGVVLGVAAPFGRLDAAQLQALAQRAVDLRLTPWRAILVPGLDAETAADLAATCAASGLIVDPADPRLSVAACAGAPGCHRGSVPTLDHASRWARLVEPGQGIALHVSGCLKGCAHPGAARLTLVGQDGRYDVVVDGRPGDAPAAVGLDADEARRLIRTILSRDRHP